MGCCGTTAGEFHETVLFFFYYLPLHTVSTDSSGLAECLSLLRPVVYLRLGSRQPLSQSFSPLPPRRRKALKRGWHQGWRRGEITRVRVRFPDFVSYVGCVCWFSTLLREVLIQLFSPVFPSPQKPTYLTIILRNRVEYRLILSRRSRKPSWLKSGDIPQD